MEEVKYEAHGYDLIGKQIVWFVDREVKRLPLVGLVQIERRRQDDNVLLTRLVRPLSEIEAEINRPARSCRHAIGTRRHKLKDARAYDPATDAFTKLPKL